MKHFNYHLEKIEFVSFGIYKVSFSCKEKNSIETLARVECEGQSVGAIPIINFDSDNVGKNFMRGCLDMRKSCQAIASFHAAQILR